MPNGGEVELLRRAVELCSRSAVAFKAAYMLALDEGLEQALMRRCTARYALLERLIGLLMERSTAPEAVRELLDGIDMDPARYDGRLDAALAEGRASDLGLARLMVAALEEAGLSSAAEACFSEQRDGLREPIPPLPPAQGLARALEAVARKLTPQMCGA